MNIQAANHVIHYTRTWNPAKEDQATDRAVKGLRPDVIYYIADALSNFQREGIERTKQITSEIAILGMNGLDINDPTQKYTLRSLPGNFSGLELLALMYTGFKKTDPGVDAGIDFGKEYDAAVSIRSNGPSSGK